MRTITILTVLGVLAATTPAPAAEGVMTRASSTDFTTTLGKLQAAIKARQFTLFAEVDHAAGAQKAGLALRPTYLVIFGNPRGGTPVMACNQTAGLELPLKALVWQDEAGKAQLSMANPAGIAARHALGDCAKPAIEAMGKALEAIAADATAP